MSALVCLPAQEGGDLELIVFHRVMHRSRSAVVVETLRGWTLRDGALGVLRNGLGPRRLRGERWHRRRLRHRRRRALHWRHGHRGRAGLLLAPAEADGGEALEQGLP